MQITPLKRYKTPEYPIQELLAAHPELLKLIPKRWADKPLVLSALSLICMILAAREGISADDKASSLKPSSTATQNEPVRTRVAPVFHHGDGRGSFGCVSVAAPLFLTEDEARQVIIEEAATAGIKFENALKTIAGVDVPVTDRNEGLQLDARTRKPKVKESSLTLDGTDVKKNLSFEFVSSEDVREWERKDYTLFSSVSGSDPRPAAEVLQKGLSKNSADQTIAVFYDPVTYYGFGRRMKGDDFGSETEAKQKSVQELRAQVRDFIAWLKAQGVI